MKNLATIGVVVAFTMAGLVSSLPVSVSQTSTPSTDNVKGAGNIPVNMVVFHFPGVSENASSQDDKVIVDDGKSSPPPTKQRGFSVMSSSKMSNYAVVTPLQARSEASAEDFPFVKRGTAIKRDDSQLQKRAVTISIGPLPRLIRNSSVGKNFRTYVGKPAEKGYDRMMSNWSKMMKKHRANLNRDKFDERYASYKPFEGWYGEHFHGERMRNDGWDY